MHEDSAVYNYGLNFQLDNGCGSSIPLDCLKRWQSDHTYHQPHRFDQPTIKKGKVEWEMHVVFLCSTSTCKESCGCTVLNMLDSNRADKLAGKPTTTNGLRLWSSDLFQELQSLPVDTKPNDITQSITWRREAWKEESLDNVPRKDEKGPSSIRRTLEQFNCKVGETSDRRGGTHMGFTERRDTILD